MYIEQIFQSTVLHEINTNVINWNDKILNSSQVKIKYEFSKPFPCDCWYVQQNMIIHDTLTRPFSEKYKILRKVNDKVFFSYRRQCISKIENIVWRSRLCPIQP